MRLRGGSQSSLTRYKCVSQRAVVRKNLLLFAKRKRLNIRSREKKWEENKVFLFYLLCVVWWCFGSGNTIMESKWKKLQFITHYTTLAELSHFITIHETRRGYGYMDCMLGNRKLNLHLSITIIWETVSSVTYCRLSVRLCGHQCVWVWDTQDLWV